MPPKKSRFATKTKVSEDQHGSAAEAAAVAESSNDTIASASAAVSHASAWSHLDWKPVHRLPSAFAGSHATILLPFSDVGEKELPEVLGCFGGVAKVASVIKNSYNSKRKLTFNIQPPDSLKNTLQLSNPLGSSPTSNSFVLQFTLKPLEEAQEDNRRRTRSQLSAVQRALVVKANPLAPIVTDVTFLHYVQTTFEFNQLFDYAMCPAIVENRREIKPESVQMTDIVPYILPSFPPAELPDNADPQDYLYLPTLKFTNQSSFAGNEYIPSIYTDTLAAHETTVKRIRKNFARVVKWTVGERPPYVPIEAFPEARKNLEDRVLQDHPEFFETARNLFHERPLWLRHDFYEALHIAHPGLLREHRRYVLPVVAFRYSNGPWRKMWCRMGFDPSTDPKMREHQVVDFRIHQQTIQRKRTSNLKAKPLKNREREKLLQTVVDRLSKAGMTKGLQFILPISKLSGVPEIAKILASRSYIKNECDMKEGFYKEGTTEEIRFELIKAIEREDPGLLVFSDLVRDLQKGGFYSNIEITSIAVDESDDEDDNMAGTRENTTADDGDMEVEEDNDQRIRDESSFEPTMDDA
ncbi:hypothetical protein RvY_05537 [Ramazzottius varieornatus]|uniref:Transcription factor IIIC subunit 5 HTH domain-containing protein n=1 Tax=Ramazzottius varieornatus TaxID=947166 RepID=A0A1D1V0Z2_RAMVA|nr:hypothetical protein RvY_05537 [Ramazzottius varieornatus]